VTRFRMVVVAAVALGAFFLGGWLLRRGMEAVPARATSPVVPSGGSRLFTEVFEKVRSFAVDSLGESTIYRLAASGMLDELSDPYAALVADRDTVRPRDQIGAAPVQGLYLDQVDGLVTVVSVIPGSPAATAGVRAGDVVLRIDSTQIASQRPEEVGRLIGGTDGSTVRIRLGREGADAPLWVTVTRGAVPPIPAAEISALGGGLAALRVHQVDSAAVRQLERAVDSASASGLVVDLRGAVEGTLADAVAFADVLLGPGQTIVVTRGRPKADSSAFVDRTPSRRPELPVVVLVDRGTAGVAEVVAGALQDHDRAAVVGEPTFGRGARSSYFPVGRGYSLRLTTSVWVTPSGRVIQRFPPEPKPDGSIDTTAVRPKFKTDAGRVVLGGGGIVPDREIPLEPEASRKTDAAMALARQLLAKAPNRKALIAALATN